MLISSAAVARGSVVAAATGCSAVWDVGCPSVLPALFCRGATSPAGALSSKIKSEATTSVL